MVLTFEVRRSVDPRWRDLLARAVLGEVGDLLGEPTVHHELATALERIEAKILELYGELCRRGELPAAGTKSASLSTASGVRWDDLKEPGPSG